LREKKIFFKKLLTDLVGIIKDYQSNQQMNASTRDNSSTVVLPEREILQAIRGIRFGVVEVVVHESRVTEIRQTRRVRLTDSGAERNSSDLTSGGL
jgi:hypothetical protein